MMKRLLAAVAIIAVLGGGVYALVSVWMPERGSEKAVSREEERPVSSEESPLPLSVVSGNTIENPEPPFIRRGAFEGVGLHTAKGSAAVMREDGRYVVRLDDNFSVTSGPDLYVSLGKDGKYAPETILAPLESVSGGQMYTVPDSIDVSRYDEVWIWCKAFSVGFGKAVLR